MACVRLDVNTATSGISIVAKITQRKLEESQTAQRKGLLLSKYYYCMELPALIVTPHTQMNTHMHKHRLRLLYMQTL